MFHADDLCHVLFLAVLVHMQEMLGALLAKDTKRRLAGVLEDFAEETWGRSDSHAKTSSPSWGNGREQAGT